MLTETLVIIIRYNHLVCGQPRPWLLDEDTAVHSAHGTKSLWLGLQLHGDLLPRDCRAIGKRQRHLARTRGNTGL